MVACARLTLYLNVFAGVINKRLYICGGLDESRHWKSCAAQTPNKDRKIRALDMPLTIWIKDQVFTTVALTLPFGILNH